MWAGTPTAAATGYLSVPSQNNGLHGLCPASLMTAHAVSIQYSNHGRSPRLRPKSPLSVVRARSSDNPGDLVGQPGSECVLWHIGVQGPRYSWGTLHVFVQGRGVPPGTNWGSGVPRYLWMPQPGTNRASGVPRYLWMSHPGTNTASLVPGVPGRRNNSDLFVIFAN